MPTIEVETLVGPKHSGQYGGAAPDSLIVPVQALTSLHDENGDVAVEGLRREEWTGAAYSEDEFRELAEVLPGLDVAPQTVLAAYRVGDSPTNVITPLMAYFPLIVVFAQRYKRMPGSAASSR